MYFVEYFSDDWRFITMFDNFDRAVSRLRVLRSSGFYRPLRIVDFERTVLFVLD